VSKKGVVRRMAFIFLEEMVLDEPTWMDNCNYIEAVRPTKIDSR
jgi:hypothetical protein